MQKESEVLSTKRTDLQHVDSRNIIVEENFNVRRDFGNILELAHSVVEMGVIEPLIGFKSKNSDKYILSDGHRRLAAVLLAIQFNKEGKKSFEDISKIERIPLLSGTSNRKERLFIMAVTGTSKKALTDLEKAEMFARLIECGKEEGKKKGEVILDIVSRLGVSQASVYNILKLNELDADIKAFVESGQISGSTINQIIREEKDMDKVKDLILSAVYDAENKTASTGSKKKATAANVKGLKQQSPLQRLQELATELEEQKVNNERSRVLFELIEELSKKSSLKRLVEIFL